MKKAFTLAVLIVTPSIMFAQGAISVANNSHELVQAWASNWDHSLSPVPVGGGMVQFFAAPDGSAYQSLGTLVLAEGGFALTYLTLASYLAANPGWNAYSTAP